MTAITIENINKTYGNDVKAVRNLNLQIEQGDFFVLVGPSGCGKSTILRMIAGLEDITSGDIKFGEKVVNDLAPKNRNIGMVFQNYALYPHMTVSENIAFPMKIKKVKKNDIANKVNEVAKMTGLDELLKRKPKELSGGQRQRVALARAIAKEPEVFLFDEPLSNLDAKLRVQMRNEIISLHKKLGVTSIYVTHDQVEAMTMGTKIAVLNDGELQQVDTPENLYRKPENLFVAKFIGSPQINIFEGDVTGEIFHEQNNGLKFTIPANNSDKTKLCIRPESFKIISEPKEQSISVKVKNIEYLGNEYLIYFESNSGLMCCRTNESINQNNDDYFLAYSSDDIILF